MAVRGTPERYNLWAFISANLIWSYINQLPHMKALEHFFPNVTTPPDTNQRGFDGPISITQSPPLNENVLLTSMSTVFNAPFIPDYNNPIYGNLGTVANQEFKTPLPNSQRSYSALEFLPIGKIVDEFGNGLNGRKLKIVSNARVLNFETSEGRCNGDKLRATSVKYVYTGNDAAVQEAHLARKGTLILTAGSINTPRILMSSGIGPAAELASVGIPVKVDSPQVGKNLQDQYGSFAIIKGSVDNLSQIYTDLNIAPLGERRIQLANINLPGGLVQVLPAILSSKSRGSITIVDPNPLVQPKVDIGVYTDGDETVPGSDLNLIVTFYKLLRQAVLAAGQQVILPFDYTNDATLAEFAQRDQNIILQSHNVGTTRMGTNIANAVVDGNLSVFGLKNVKIGDVGVEPESVDGNTCFSAYYIALTLAKILGVDTPPAL